MFTKGVVVAVIPLIISSVAVSQQPTITIDMPRDLAEVPWRACVSGTVSDENAQLVAVVHPVEVGSFWVQQAISLRPHGRFEVPLYIGESAHGLHAGQTFEIRIVSNPYQGLKEGMLLPGWPAAEGASPVIRVVRNDSAPSGCEKGVASTGSLEPVSPWVGPTPEPRSIAPVEVMETPSASRHLDLALGIGCVAFGVLFLALLVTDDLTERAAQVTAWLARFRAWLVLVAVKMATSVCWLWNWLRDVAGRRVEPIWAARGFAGDLRDFAVRALLTPLLLIASIYAFYAEARTVVQALNPLFGVEEVQANYGIGSVLGETATGENNVSQPSTESAKSETFLHIFKKDVLRFVDSFEALWSEKMGFLAIALAGLEGAFGIVLLWRMGAEQPVVLRPLALLKARPIVTTCFLTLNTALGVLAAYRGYELSPSGMNWVMPTIVSAAIAMVMPWILTFTLHYCLECAADCLGVTSSLALLTALYVGISCAVALWGLLSLVIVGCLAGAFVGFFLLCVAFWAVLLFAELLGDAIRKLQRTPWPNLRLPVPVRAASASFVLLFVLCGSYFIIRGLVR